MTPSGAATPAISRIRMGTFGRWRGIPSGRRRNESRHPDDVVRLRGSRRCHGGARHRAARALVFGAASIRRACPHRSLARPDAVPRSDHALVAGPHFEIFAAGSRMMQKGFAERFAGEWVEAWNAHDLERVLSHYEDDFEMSSPIIVTFMGEPSGKLKGKAAVGAYSPKALKSPAGMRFEVL